MNISGKRMFELLEKLDFVRLSTFEGEKKAADILVKEIEEIGVTPVVETFKAPRYEIKVAKLEVTAPVYKEYEVSGYGFSGNDAADGLEAEFAYVEALDPIDLTSVKGKIVLLTAGIRPGDFKKLIDAGVVGVITPSGTFRDTKGVSDHNGGFALDKLCQSGLDLSFGFGIHCGGRFVQNQDLRIAEDRARDGNSLAFTAREVFVTKADFRIVSIGHFNNEVVCACRSCCRDNLVIRSIGTRVTDVFQNRTYK